LRERAPGRWEMNLALITPESIELDRTTQAPTGQQWAAYTAMFAYFNAELFSNELPPCILNFNGQLRRAYGFFAKDRWRSGERKTHEISLNPKTLQGRKPIEIASTVVHEMCHLWQATLGNGKCRAYHDREWAAKMVTVGLMPSETAKPGGKRTGAYVSHYIIDGGVFDVAYAKMPEEYLLPWLAGTALDEKKPPKPRNDKTKFTCPGCEANAWGIATLRIVCMGCCQLMPATGGAPYGCESDG